MNRVILAYSRLPGQPSDFAPREWRQAESRLGTALACRLLSESGQRIVVPAALRYGVTGKPYVPGQSAFSIAHSGGWALCALASEGAIGVDVEVVPRYSILPHWRRVFDARERAVAGAPRAALAIWTAKEAVLKASGATLAEIAEVKVRGRHAIFRGTRWFCRMPRIAPGLVARLATAVPVTQLQWRPIASADALYEFAI